MTLPYPYPGILRPREATEHARAVDGVNTHWWEYPAKSGADTLVFVHGFRGDHHGLELIADALPEYRVLIPDIPGFGLSATWADGVHSIDDFGRWLRAFLRETKTENAAVVGHSFGTIVVANAVRGIRSAPVVLINPISQKALTGPKKVESAIANTWYSIGRSLPAALGNRWLSAPFFVRAMSVMLVKTPDKAIQRWVHEQHKRYFSLYADRDSLVQAYGVSTSSTVADFAGEISAPTLLIAADRDDITPLAAQRAVVAKFADARLVVLTGVGHLVHYERPVETGTAIREFLASIK